MQPCFPSYDIKNLNKTKHKKLIITEILNFGTEKDLKWLTRTYSKKDLKQVVLEPDKGVWLKEVLNYWQRIFNLKIAKRDFQKAIFNINPHF